MIFSTLARPLLIPIFVGIAGIWYGSYNFAFNSTLVFIGSTNKELSRKSKSTIFIISMIPSFMTYSVLKATFPPSFKDLDLEKEKMGMGKRLVENFRRIPIRWYTLAIISSGAMGGFVGALLTKYVDSSFSLSAPKQKNAFLSFLATNPNENLLREIANDVTKSL